MKIPSNVRDPAVLAQRRAELVEVATSLFLERGYHQTSIRDIARACPFNLAALYNYVSSKQDILYLVAQQLVNEIVKALQPTLLTSHDPVEALRNAFATYCEVVQRYSKHIRLLYRELEHLPKQARDPIHASVSALTDIFHGLAERAAESGALREVDTRLLAIDLMVSAHMWSIHGRYLRSRFDLKAFAREQGRILLDGVILPAAEKLPRRPRAVAARGRR